MATDMATLLGGWTRSLPLRDAWRRFVAWPDQAREAPRACLCSQSPRDARDDPDRVHVMPSRDARGRFVAFPTTSAPRWYVFCAAGYRIPGRPR